MLRSISIAVGALVLACGSAVALAVGHDALVAAPAASPIAPIPVHTVALTDPGRARAPIPAAARAVSPVENSVIVTRSTRAAPAGDPVDTMARSVRPVPRSLSRAMLSQAFDGDRDTFAVRHAPAATVATTEQFRMLAAGGVYR